MRQGNRFRSKREISRRRRVIFPRTFGRDLIVIGASSGGVQALPELIGSFPADLPAAVFVVLHIPPKGPGLLPEIMRRTASLKVSHGVDGERIRHGRVYVAP